MLTKLPDDYLLEYCSDVTSQCGEDGILQKVFEIIGTKNRLCVEFGANEGKHASNTWNLIVNHGWGGAQIEASHELFPGLQATYADYPAVKCLQQAIEFEGENSLDNTLARLDLPMDIDLLSIDVDGNDYWMWESIRQCKARVVLIEFNPTIPKHVAFVQEKNMEISQGCSVMALDLLAKTKGYELICVTAWNALFVEKSLFRAFHINDNSVARLCHNEHLMTYLSSMYDGTIATFGFNRLLWVDIPIDHEKIQMLPKEARRKKPIAGAT